MSEYEEIKKQARDLRGKLLQSLDLMKSVKFQLRRKKTEWLNKDFTLQLEKTQKNIDACLQILSDSDTQAKRNQRVKKDIPKKKSRENKKDIPKKKSRENKKDIPKKKSRENKKEK